VKGRWYSTLYINKWWVVYIGSARKRNNKEREREKYKVCQQWEVLTKLS
jgi:hypothetical protein